MKKVLIASTALVAASVISAGSASASEKIKLQLGGFSKWWVVGAWNSSDYQSGTGVAYNNVDVKGDNEVHFLGSTTLDNGLNVGVEVHMEAGGHNDQSNDLIDKSFVFVEGGFGKVILGSQANGTVLLHVMAPDAAGNMGSEGILTGGLAISRPGNLVGRTTTEIDTDDNAEKITYVSPAFYGLTLGATYIPNATEDNRLPQSGRSQIYGAGALYDNTFGEVGVKVSAGYVTYDLNSADVTSASTSRSQEWSAGTQISFGGFTVGGAYRQIMPNFQALGTSSTANNNSADSSLSERGRIWDAGIQYASGPYSVSFIYVDSQAEGSRTVAGDDSMKVYQVSGKYTMGPGVELLGTVGRVEYKDETPDTTANAANHNEGWAVMTGLSLTF